jgi:dienelactone hydrolase
VPGPTIDPAELDFVLEADTSGIEVRCRPGYDLYARSATEPPPLAVLVHGPVRGPGARPREWPVYRGYASLLAHAGVAAAVVDLDYTDVQALTDPIAQLRRSVDDARAEATVDGDRVVAWAFSGGARLVASWLEDPPEWLRGIALTYPVVPELTRVRARVVVTRVGRERPAIQTTVERLLALAPRAELIDLPSGQHGFDMLDHDDDSRQAVRDALAAVVRLLA